MLGMMLSYYHSTFVKLQTFTSHFILLHSVCLFLTFSCSVSPLSQSLSRRWSVFVKAASPRRWGGSPGPCQRTSASRWSSREPGRAWTCGAPVRTKPSAGCEASAFWRSACRAWRRRKNWTNILLPHVSNTSAAEAASLWRLTHLHCSGEQSWPHGKHHLNAPHLSPLFTIS